MNGFVDVGGQDRWLMIVASYYIHDWILGYSIVNVAHATCSD